MNQFLTVICANAENRFDENSILLVRYIIYETINFRFCPSRWHVSNLYNIVFSIFRDLVSTSFKYVFQKYHSVLRILYKSCTTKMHKPLLRRENRFFFVVSAQMRSSKVSQDTSEDKFFSEKHFWGVITLHLSNLTASTYYISRITKWQVETLFESQSIFANRYESFVLIETSICLLMTFIYYNTEIQHLQI